MTRTLSEAESRRLVAAHGVPVSPFVTATDAAAAVAAVAEAGIEFPLVAKLCGERIAHKTERGLVRLRIGDEAALEVAARDLILSATPEDGAVELLITPMVGGTRELIAGVSRDDLYGLVVMIGVGGVLAEAIDDVAFRLVPIERADVDEMIDGLTGQALLGPVRGEPAVDRDELAATVLALARAATDTPGIVSIDLNPLIIHSGRPVAVDALVEMDA